MVGVAMSEPKQPSCAKPVSSSNITTTLGARSAAATMATLRNGRVPCPSVALGGLGLLELDFGAVGGAAGPGQLGLEASDLLAGVVDRGLGCLPRRGGD